MNMLVRRLVVLLCVLCSVSAWGADVIRVGTQNVDLILELATIKGWNKFISVTGNRNN